MFCKTMKRYCLFVLLLVLVANCLQAAKQISPEEEWAAKTFANPPICRDSQKDPSSLSAMRLKIVERYVAYVKRYNRLIERLKDIRKKGGKVSVNSNAVKLVAEIGKSKWWKDLESAQPFKVKEACKMFDKSFDQASCSVCRLEEIFDDRSTKDDNVADKEMIDAITGLPVGAHIVSSNDDFHFYQMPDGSLKCVPRIKNAKERPIIGGVAPVPGTTIVTVSPTTGEIIQFKYPDFETFRERKEYFKLRQLENKFKQLEEQHR